MNNRASILITGASGGIGRAAAIECATRGARVGVHYNGNRERADATLAALPGDGHQLFQCDITDPAAVEKLIEDVDASLDGLDVLVNNAGISKRHQFEDIDYATWQDSLQHPDGQSQQTNTKYCLDSVHPGSCLRCQLPGRDTKYD